MRFLFERTNNFKEIIVFWFKFIQMLGDHFQKKKNKRRRKNSQIINTYNSNTIDKINYSLKQTD